MSDLMRKLEILWGQPIFYTKDSSRPPKSFGTYLEEESPLVCCRELFCLLLQRASRQYAPVVYKDENRVYFCCMKARDGYYLTGPFCTEDLSYVEIHRYYRKYAIPGQNEKHPAKISLVKILNFVSFLWELLEGENITLEALLHKNGLVEEKQELTEKEEAMMELTKIDDEVYHHTYQEERYVMDCVREGDTAHILKRMDALMENAGILSSKKMNHQRNLAIVSVSTVTREAIAGGVSPAEAYRLSDIYINRIDRCTQIDEIVKYMRESAYDFTRLVEKNNRNRRLHANYTEQCKDYIYENYHRKIYVEDIAAAIGVSAGYLSRVFRRDTGRSIQDYIQKFRVERAANLLKYSEAGLSEISDYVCFHSQSHFGSVFKKYMHMTPKEYRDRYKKKEFISEN